MYTCRKSLQIVSIFGKRALRPFPQADIPAVDSQRHKRRAGPLQSGERSCNHVRLTEGDRPEGIRRR